MAEVLLITRQDIIRYSNLSGAVDTDKMIGFIKLAQDIHLEQILGTDLMNRIKTDIEAGTLTAPYSTLLNKYIKPMLIHYSLLEIIPFNAYQVSNGGIFKHTSENSDSVSKSEIDFLAEKHRKIAISYSERFESHVRNNPSLYAEYYTNSGEDLHPNTEDFFNGWVL